VIGGGFLCAQSVESRRGNTVGRSEGASGVGRAAIGVVVVAEAGASEVQGAKIGRGGEAGMVCD
jgi:hypothetical protein